MEYPKKLKSDKKRKSDIEDSESNKKLKNNIVDQKVLLVVRKTTHRTKKQWQYFADVEGEDITVEFSRALTPEKGEKDKNPIIVFRTEVLRLTKKEIEIMESESKNTNKAEICEIGKALEEREILEGPAWNEYEPEEVEKILATYGENVNLNVKDVKEGVVTYVIDLLNFIGSIKMALGIDQKQNLIPSQNMIPPIFKFIGVLLNKFKKVTPDCRFIFITQDILHVVRGFRDFLFQREDCIMYITPSKTDSADDKLLWHATLCNWGLNPGKTVVVSNDKFYTEFIEKNNRVEIKFVEYGDKKKEWGKCSSDCEIYRYLCAYLPRITCNFDETRVTFVQEGNWVNNFGFEDQKYLKDIVIRYTSDALFNKVLSIREKFTEEHTKRYRKSRNRSFWFAEKQLENQSFY